MGLSALRPRVGSPGAVDGVRLDGHGDGDTGVWFTFLPPLPASWNFLLGDLPFIYVFISLFASGFCPTSSLLLHTPPPPPQSLTLLWVPCLPSSSFSGAPSLFFSGFLLPFLCFPVPSQWVSVHAPAPTAAIPSSLGLCPLCLDLCPPPSFSTIYSLLCLSFWVFLPPPLPGGLPGRLLRTREAAAASRCPRRRRTWSCGEWVRSRRPEEPRGVAPSASPNSFGARGPGPRGSGGAGGPGTPGGAQRWASEKKLPELSAGVAPEPPLATRATAPPGVLKIFGAGLASGANYKSVLATARSTARELVAEALERYGLAGSPAGSPGESSCVDAFALCDALGRPAAGGVGSGDWRAEHLRVLGDSERPLLVQELWRARPGWARRFELRGREEARRLEQEAFGAADSDGEPASRILGAGLCGLRRGLREVGRGWGRGRGRAGSGRDWSDES